MSSSFSLWPRLATYLQGEENNLSLRKHLSSWLNDLYQKYHIQILIIKFNYLWTVSASWRSWKLRSSSRIKFIAISSSSWMECDLFFLVESDFVDDPTFLGPKSNYESNIIKWLKHHLIILSNVRGIENKHKITHHSFLLKMVHLHRCCRVDSYLSYLHKYPCLHSWFHCLAHDLVLYCCQPL